jgi:hypothetical protein
MRYERWLEEVKRKEGDVLVCESKGVMFFPGVKRGGGQKRRN